MIALLYLLLQLAIIAFAIYDARRKGYWSWSKFVLTIAFILFEGFLISAPVRLGNENSRWFWPVCSVTWATVLVCGFFFFRAAGRWKLGTKVNNSSVS